MAKCYKLRYITKTTLFFEFQKGGFRPQKPPSWMRHCIAEYFSKNRIFHSRIYHQQLKRFSGLFEALCTKSLRLISCVVVYSKRFINRQKRLYYRNSDTRLRQKPSLRATYAIAHLEMKVGHVNYNDMQIL